MQDIRLLITFFFLTFAIQSNPVLAQASPPNSCGSGWNVHLVPNYIPVLGCNLKDSCDQHDICYGACEGPNPVLGPEVCKYRRCVSGGDLYGTNACNSLEFDRLILAANDRRGKCDLALYDHILAANSTRPICQVFATVYRHAVVAWGKSSFIGVSNGQSTMTAAEKTQSELAFKEYLEKGTEMDFRQFISDVESGKKTVDWNLPIKYDAISRKLVNTR